MARRELYVGSFVQIASFATAHAAPDAAFRIEQLLQLDDGATLYKIRTDAEPFDRIVAERDLTQS
jgi:hypothetical protein